MDFALSEPAYGRRRRRRPAAGVARGGAPAVRGAAEGRARRACRAGPADSLREPRYGLSELRYALSEPAYGWTMDAI